MAKVDKDIEDGYDTPLVEAIQAAGDILIDVSDEGVGEVAVESLEKNESSDTTSKQGDSSGTFEAIDADMDVSDSEGRCTESDDDDDDLESEDTEDG